MYKVGILFVLITLILYTELFQDNSRSKNPFLSKGCNIVTIHQTSTSREHPCWMYFNQNCIIPFYSTAYQY